MVVFLPVEQTHCLWVHVRIAECDAQTTGNSPGFQFLRWREEGGSQLQLLGLEGSIFVVLEPSTSVGHSLEWYNSFKSLLWFSSGQTCIMCNTLERKVLRRHSMAMSCSNAVMNVALEGHCWVQNIRATSCCSCRRGAAGQGEHERRGTSPKGCSISSPQFWFPFSVDWTHLCTISLLGALRCFAKCKGC